MDSRTLLFQAQHDLRMKTIGPLSIAIDSKQPFVYFDEVRKIIEPGPQRPLVC